MGHSEIVQVLLQAGANINHKSTVSYIDTMPSHIHHCEIYSTSAQLYFLGQYTIMAAEYTNLHDCVQSTSLFTGFKTDKPDVGSYEWPC